MSSKRSRRKDMAQSFQMDNFYRAYLTLRNNPKALRQVFVPQEAAFLPFPNRKRPAQMEFEELIENQRQNGKLFGVERKTVDGGTKFTIHAGDSDAAE